MLESTVVTCPCCWESIELQIDLSAGDQTYTEDCSVCCRPMLVRLTVESMDTPEFTVTVDAEND